MTVKCFLVCEILRMSTIVSGLILHILENALRIY
jgi:hypothetical protein